jgi:hypothetical protein
MTLPQWKVDRYASALDAIVSSRCVQKDVLEQATGFMVTASASIPSISRSMAPVYSSLHVQLNNTAVKDTRCLSLAATKIIAAAAKAIRSNRPIHALPRVLLPVPLHSLAFPCWLIDASIARIQDDSIREGWGGWLVTKGAADEWLVYYAHRKWPLRTASALSSSTAELWCALIILSIADQVPCCCGLHPSDTLFILTDSQVSCDWAERTYPSKSEIAKVLVEKLAAILLKGGAPIRFSH